MCFIYFLYPYGLLSELKDLLLYYYYNNDNDIELFIETNIMQCIKYLKISNLYAHVWFQTALSAQQPYPCELTVSTQIYYVCF